jgi:hypothetical protein
MLLRAARGFITPPQLDLFNILNGLLRQFTRPAVSNKREIFLAREGTATVLYRQVRQ